MARQGKRGWARRIARLLACGATVTLLAASCVEEAPYPPNRPPDTQVFIQADTLNVADYRTVLHWSGTDLDGTVAGFVYRWDGPWQPAAGESLWWEDDGWVFTTAHTDTFDVPIEGSYAERTFFVRAIDDQGLADPQPAHQWFRLTNEVPEVSWSDTTRHPTLAQPSLPAISFAWTPVDFDGRETIAFARLWLDTQAGEDSAASAIEVARDTVGAFFPEHFQGRLGERTVYCQVWDRAATPSNVISWSWNVVAPTGEYLLIDNAGQRAPGTPQSLEDDFWRARLEALVPGNYHLYEVWEAGPFRSAQEVLPMLSLFRGVLWYGGWIFDGGETSDEQMREGLALAEPGIRDYIDAGGRLFLTGHNVIGTEGGLSSGFWQDTFGIAEIYRIYVDEEWISNMRLERTSFSGGPLYVRCGEALAGADSLRVSPPISQTDFFAVGESVEPLLWLDPATVDTTDIPEHATRPVYVGARSAWGTGQMALFSTIVTKFRATSDVSYEAGVEALLRDLWALP
ncbi:MAG: hypothetical protein GF330_06625 [Candidatus Eisenbacteria bacterium]|nr:hypothetical protein [Candidatus Eisenbacteria bacterium]